MAVAATAIIALGIVALAVLGSVGEGAEQLGHRVSLEEKTGVVLLLANWYNESRLVYALVVTGAMAILGVVVGQITELALKIIGVR